MDKKPYFIRATSFGLYEDSLAEAINLFKFHGIKRLSRPLGSLFLDHDMHGIDALVPVPLSIRSLRKRGFNQSLLLAHTIARKRKLRIIADGLIKKIETPPQLALPAKQRLKNMRGAFRAVKNFSGLRVLLIDDVMTTGATANECSRQLLTAGADEVSVLTLARSSML
jgi:ComF family protein